MSTGAWELVFMMVVLKLPILYLCGVVWWAIRAEPNPYEPAALVPSEPRPRPCPWHSRRRPPLRPVAGRGRVVTAAARR